MQVKNWVSALTSWPRDTASLMYYALILLVVSIPLSEFGMSVAQFLLLGLWVFEGISKKSAITASGHETGLLSRIGANLICKFRMLLNNPAAMVVISLYFLHIIGTLYSSDINYALKDLRIKLPLLALASTRRSQTLRGRENALHPHVRNAGASGNHCNIAPSRNKKV